MSDKSGALPPSASELLGPRHWPAWTLVGLLWLLMWTPNGFRNALGRGLGRLLYRVWGKRLRILHTNLDLCFPDWSRIQRQSTARRHVDLLVRTLLDYGLLCFGSANRIRERIRLHGAEHIEAAASAGRGVLLMPIHSCAVDYGLSICTVEVDHRGGGLYKPMRNSVADWLLLRARTRFGAEILPREAGLKFVAKGLKAGRIMVFPADEDLGGEAAVFAPLFGVAKATLTTPARLARLGAVDVLLSATYYNSADGGYDCIIMPRLTDFPSADDVADAHRLNAMVERLVLEDPAQYMWTLRLFRTLPDGSKRRY
jgi:lauroyl-KDO2-lipid IV(A) myristoyltransferase